MIFSSSPPQMKMEGRLTNVGATVPSGDCCAKNIAAQRAAPTFKTGFQESHSCRRAAPSRMKITITASSPGLKGGICIIDLQSAK